MSRYTDKKEIQHELTEGYKAFLIKVYEATKDRWVGLSLLTEGWEFKTTWSLGGTACSYMTDQDHPPREVQADSKPHDSLIEFDKILEAVCPSIGFIPYKLMRSEVVKDGEDYNSDGYGGHTTEGYEKFTTGDLYDALLKRGLVE